MKRLRRIKENIHAITQFLEASKDQTQLPLTLQSTEGQREEKSKHRQSKPRPQCCCNQGAADRSRRSKGLANWGREAGAGVAEFGLVWLPKSIYSNGNTSTPSRGAEGALHRSWSSAWIFFVTWSCTRFQISQVCPAHLLWSGTACAFWITCGLQPQALA